MKFTLRQLMLCVTAFAVWLGLLAQGHSFFGPAGIVLFGSLFGISVFYLLRMTLTWSNWSSRSRGVGFCVVFASSITGIFLTWNWFGHDLHHEGLHARNLPRLEAALLVDPRYESILVTHEHFKGSYILVRGTVADRETLNSLRHTVERQGIPSVVWQVEVIEE